MGFPHFRNWSGLDTFIAFANRRWVVAGMVGLWFSFTLLVAYWQVPRKYAEIGEWYCGFESGRTASWLCLGYGYGSPYIHLLRLTDGSIRPEPLANTSPISADHSDNVPPSAWVTPPVVFIWAAMFDIFGVGSTLALSGFIVFQAAAAAFAVFLSHRLLLTASGPRAAVAGLLLVGAYPQFIFSAATDTHGTVFFFSWYVFALFALIRFLQGRKWWLIAHAAGVALSILIMPSSLFAISASELLVFIRLKKAHTQSGSRIGRLAPAALIPNATKGPIGRFSFAAVVVTGCLVLWGPWFVRNAAEFHQAVLFRSDLPIEFWYGNNPDTIQVPFNTVQLQNTPMTSKKEQQQLLVLGEPEYGRLKWTAFRQFVQKDPIRYLIRSVQRFISFWSWPPLKYDELRLGQALILWTSLIAFFILLFRKRACLSLFGWTGISFVSCYPLIYILTYYSENRYRLPMELILILALAALLGQASIQNTAGHSAKPEIGLAIPPGNASSRVKPDSAG